MFRPFGLMGFQKAQDGFIEQHEPILITFTVTYDQSPPDSVHLIGLQGDDFADAQTSVIREADQGAVTGLGCRNQGKNSGNLFPGKRFWQRTGGFHLTDSAGRIGCEKALFDEEGEELFQRDDLSIQGCFGDALLDALIEIVPDIVNDDLRWMFGCVVQESGDVTCVGAESMGAFAGRSEGDFKLVQQRSSHWAFSVHK